VWSSVGICIGALGRPDALGGLVCWRLDVDRREGLLFFVCIAPFSVGNNKKRGGIRVDLARGCRENGEDAPEKGNTLLSHWWRCSGVVLLGADTMASNPRCVGSLSCVSLLMIVCVYLYA
jgi:hypothetical protein